MKLHVTYLDGTEAEVVATASARRQFEATHNKALLAAVGSYQSYWADQIAYASLVQTADLGRPFDEWLETVESILYEMPVARLAQLAEALGVKITEEDVAEVVPTGGAAKAPSRAKSSTPRSTPASRSAT